MAFGRSMLITICRCFPSGTGSLHASPADLLQGTGVTSRLQGIRDITVLRLRGRRHSTTGVTMIISLTPRRIITTTSGRNGWIGLSRVLSRHSSLAAIGRLTTIAVCLAQRAVPTSTVMLWMSEGRIKVQRSATLCTLQRLIRLSARGTLGKWWMQGQGLGMHCM